MGVYSPIPCARDTPCFSATPWYTPSLPSSRASPAAETTAPAPEMLNRPSPSRSRQQELPRPGEEMHRIDTATAEAQQSQRKYLIAP